MAAEDIALATIEAVEKRDLEKLHELYHPEVEFHWQPGLPYEGDHSGPGLAAMTQLFSQAWAPLQPDEQTRRMDPVVIASTDDTVVVRYVMRGIDADGTRFETPTLAHYRMADGRLRDARMFYFDLKGLIEFLDHARR